MLLLQTRPSAHGCGMSRASTQSSPAKSSPASVQTVEPPLRWQYGRSSGQSPTTPGRQPSPGWHRPTFGLCCGTCTQKKPGSQALALRRGSHGSPPSGPTSGAGPSSGATTISAMAKTSRSIRISTTGCIMSARTMTSDSTSGPGLVMSALIASMFVFDEPAELSSQATRQIRTNMQMS